MINSRFSLIDHSASSAKIVLEQNKFSKKVTSNRDLTPNPMTAHFLCLQSHAFPILASVNWGIFNSTLVCASIDFLDLEDLAEIRIIKVSVFQAMGISTVGKAWDWKHKKWSLES